MSVVGARRGDGGGARGRTPRRYPRPMTTRSIKRRRSVERPHARDDDDDTREPTATSRVREAASRRRRARARQRADDAARARRPARAACAPPAAPYLDRAHDGAGLPECVEAPLGRALARRERVDGARLRTGRGRDRCRHPVEAVTLSRRTKGASLGWVAHVHSRVPASSGSPAGAALGWRADASVTGTACSKSSTCSGAECGNGAGAGGSSPSGPDGGNSIPARAASSSSRRRHAITSAGGRSETNGGAARRSGGAPATRAHPPKHAASEPRARASRAWRVVVRRRTKTPHASALLSQVSRGRM